LLTQRRQVTNGKRANRCFGFVDNSIALVNSISTKFFKQGM
jgi:hypothetical protein